ncbi:hypothetical protein THASP1DRAFT_14697, partial [Thamnocephalis sphaerospora]
VNSVDVNGNTCPRRPARNQACPLLCVRNPATDCPAHVRPACSDGRVFCGDGQCHQTCRGVVNICACSQSATELSMQYQPCMAGQMVNLPLLDPQRRAAQTQQACAADLDLGLNRIGNATGEPLTAEMPAQAWLACPVREPPAFTYTEAAFIALYVYFGTQLALLGIWHVFKKAREARVTAQEAAIAPTMAMQEKKQPSLLTRQADLDKRVRGSMGSSMPTSSLSDTLGSTLSDCHFSGYCNSWLGYTGLVSVYITTVLWGVLLALLVADYYGEVTGAAFGLLLTSEQSSIFFVVVWHFAAAWLVAINVAHPRMRNYFRLRVPLAQAQAVQVEKQQSTTVMMDEQTGAWVKRLRHAENQIRRLFGVDVIVQTVPIGVTATGRHYFEFQCTRYVHDEATGRFTPFTHDLGQTHRELRTHADGLTSKTAAYLRELLGPNFISVKVPSFPVAMMQEFRSFFYIYQVMCLWLWYYFAYAKIAAVQTVVILLSALVKVVIRLRAEKKVKQLAEYRAVCSLRRDGTWHEDVSTEALVPGDVIQLHDGQPLPCDAVILSGEVVVDESSLTGESMPVRKFAIRDEDTVFQPQAASRSATLFAGTTVLQAVPTGGASSVTALVIATNTATDKGKLVRKILFPATVSFIFNEQLRGVICVLLAWGIVCFGLAIWLMGRGNVGSWFYAMFAISYIMSPLLPAALVVGQSVAASRLRKKQIFCVDLPRVMIAGKVRVFCFDKTGTLTKEGLDYYGVHTIECAGDGGPVSFGRHEVEMDALPRLAQIGMAACHSVSVVNGRVIGNPVDAEQFRASRWSLHEGERPEYLDTLRPPKNASNADTLLLQQAHVVKRFEFVHARASMSVIVLDPTDGHLHVFVKGSFERIKEASTPTSLPANYDRVSAAYAAEGCYVLALAHRDLGAVSLDTIAELTRDDLECDCTFIGLLLFKNQLKPDTTDAIHELKEGDTRTVMITGDNALTGVFIGRQCGMVPKDARVLLGDVVPGTHSGQVYWRDVDTDASVDSVEAALAASITGAPVELAVTGRAFNALLQTGQMRPLLLHTRIFARMTPDGKVQCVQLFMERAITGMCGDGGNDCGALRVAHCGIALSDAEASIVSPFSTSVRSIFSCVELLRQGRAALATSFTGYKFMITYGQVMSFRGIWQYYFSVVMSEWVFIFIDSFITVGLSFVLTQALPARRLAPVRPTARLFGPQTLISAFGQILMNFCFLVGAFALLFRQPWFRCNEFDGAAIDNTKWWLMGDNYEAEMIACITLFQFLTAAAAYNFGHHFRRAWWRNYLFVGAWCAILALLSYIVIAPPNPVGCLFRINCGDPDVLVDLGYPQPSWTIERYNSPLGHNVMPEHYRWLIWGYAMINMACGIAFERFVVLGPARRWAMRRRPLQRLRMVR